MTGTNTNVSNVSEVHNDNLTYFYNGRFWDVTEKFRFPKNMLLKHGWIAWLKGFPEHREIVDEGTFTRPIKPLRLMNPKLLPKALCNSHKNEISPIMNLMEGAPEIQIHSHTVMDDNFIDQSFEYGLNNVNRTVQYMFLKENWVNWKASCFSKMTKYSVIMQKGTESDKLRTEASKSRHNKKRKRK